MLPSHTSSPGKASLLHPGFLEELAPDPACVSRAPWKGTEFLRRLALVPYPIYPPLPRDSQDPPHHPHPPLGADSSAWGSRVPFSSYLHKLEPLAGWAGGRAVLGGDRSPLLFPWPPR